MVMEAVMLKVRREDEDAQKAQERKDWKDPKKSDWSHLKDVL